MQYFNQKLSISILSHFIFISILTLGYLNVANAITYFAEDFENGSVSSTPKPVWSWKPTFSPSNQQQHMMMGNNDIYSVTTDRVLKGKHAMRLNFKGRNELCNTCGMQVVKLSAYEAANGCASVSGAPFASNIYNKSNGFSTWSITSTNSNQICFNTAAPVKNTLFQSTSNAISANDTILVPLKCGVNGNIARNIVRRSDCGRAINYLDGIQTSHFDYGKSISRRFYMYIPSATVMPNTTFKLGYTFFWRDGVREASTLKISVQNGMTLELSLPGGKVQNQYSLQRDKWYYFEEVFTRETSETANNGSYKLYVNEAGTPFIQTPVVAQNNIKVGSLNAMSINGNFQHVNDASGYVYFDEIVISDGFIGPVDVKFPKSPTH